MNDEPQRNPDPQYTGASSGSSTRTWIIWLAVFGGIILLMLFKDRMEAPASLITQARFEELLDSGSIAQATVNYSSQGALNSIVGQYYITNNQTLGTKPFRAKVRLTPRLENRIFSHPQFEPRESDSMLISIAVSVLPFLVIAALIWFFFIRQIRKAGARPNPQHERLDEILSKWDAQITRMNAVLDRWEKSQGPR